MPDGIAPVKMPATIAGTVPPPSSGGGTFDPTDRMNQILNSVVAGTVIEAAPAAPVQQPMQPANPVQPTQPVIKQQDPAQKPDAIQAALDIGIPDVVSMGQQAPGTSTEPPPSTEAPATVDPIAVAETDPTAPTFKTDREKFTWGQLRAAEKAALERAAQLERDLAAERANKQQPEQADVLALKQKLDETETRLAQADLASSTAFKQKYDMKIAETEQKGVDLLVRYGYNADDARSLVNRMAKTSGAALTDLLADQPTPVQGALGIITGELDSIRRSRASALEKWQETRAAQRLEEGRAQEAVLSTNIETDVRNAVGAVVKNGNGLFQFIAGDSPEIKAHNAAVAERINAVKGILRDGSAGKTATLVQLVTEGTVTPVYREALGKAMQRVRELENEIRQRNSLAPRLRGVEHPGRTMTGTPAQPGASIDDVVNATFRR